MVLTSLKKRKKGAASLRDVYEKLCQEKELSRDEGQLEILDLLQSIGDGLVAPKKFFVSKASPIKGLYLWGDVGRGKTFMMDLFYESLVGIPKRREHFHAFMAHVHARIHQLKNIDIVVKEIAAEARILCFDEFIVSNIADAMIMSRLFKGLFDAGVTLVATSNTAPGRLYEGGLHRDRFIPFIDVLLSHVHVSEVDGSKDYRRLKLGQVKRLFSTSREMDDFWHLATENTPGQSFTMENQGRLISLGVCAKRVLRTSFSELCMQPLGASDYLRLASAIDTLLIDDVPVMGEDELIEMQRFITLIDVLYDQGVMLALCAGTPTLFPDKSLNTAIPRTESRLHEMLYGH